MRRTVTQHLAAVRAAKDEAQVWFDRLQRLNDTASRMEDESDDPLPPEFHQAQAACTEQIAAIYARHKV